MPAEKTNSERLAAIETNVEWIKKSIEKGHVCLNDSRIGKLEVWNRIYKGALTVAVGFIIWLGKQYIVN